MERPRVFVTDDSRVADGVLDETDRAVLDQVAAGSREPVHFLTTADLVAEMRRRRAEGTDDSPVEDDADPDDGLIGLKPGQLRDLGEAAVDRATEFTAEAIALMNRARAKEVRHWRVDRRYTWRKVARAAHDLWRVSWSPPSNQIAGMALCREAAQLLGEDYRRPPWNDAPVLGPDDVADLHP